MAITAAMVKELREISGAGMMDCKKALTATEGDMDKAMEFLREKGLATAQKKASRIAAEGTLVQTITLDNANNWTFTYNNLEEGYLYYIEEASTGGKYEVTYSESNKTGVENGGLLTLTNKEKDNSHYELPSTGGTGTLPYTAVGGTMMLSALAYSFIHRKRRREGRADD